MMLQMIANYKKESLLHFSDS